MAAGAPLPRQPRRAAARRSRRGTRRLPRVGAAPGGAALRRRRRRGQGVVVRAAAAAGGGRPRPALGGRLQVPADDGADDAPAHRRQRRPHRRAQPVCRARAGHRGRRHRVAGDAPQRGRHPPQGHPRGRPGDPAAGRRRDPAGRRAGARAAGEAGPRLVDARPTARCATRRSCGPRARSGTTARTGPARRAASRASSTSSRAGRWTSTASARSSCAKLVQEGLVAQPQDIYRLTGRAAARARRLPAAIGRERHRRHRGVQGPAVRPGAVRARDPPCRLRHRPGARGRARLDGGLRNATRRGDRRGRGRGAGDRRAGGRLVPRPRSTPQIVDELAAAGLRMAGPRRARAAGGPAGRKDVRRHRDAGRLLARRDRRASGRAGGEGDQHHLGQHRLPARGRGGRIEAGQGRAARGARDLRGRPGAANRQGEEPARSCTIRSWSTCAAGTSMWRLFIRIENARWRPLRVVT